MEKRGRGRPKTGSVDKHGDHFDVRITLPDGTRTPPRCLPAGTTYERAREIGKAMTEVAKRRAAEEQAKLPPAPASPKPGLEEGKIEAWAERWFKAREEHGHTSVKDDRGRFKKWINPALRGHAMVTITTTQIEQLVQDLDAHVRAEDLRWKTASNVWGVVTKMFDDACASKTLSLRVRKDNPAKGVRGPDKGVERSKVYLYPSEFLALMRCPRVPIRWKRLIALAVYSYMRAGELEALVLGDVDLTLNFFRVHQAADRSKKGRGHVKTTKTGHTRRVPIEANLAPLVVLLQGEARVAGQENLVLLPALCDLSERLRKYLEWAGIERPELFANDETRKPITWHDLRATGITWMAIRGDEPLRIQTRAGHLSFSTTQGYIREAENLEGAIHPEDVFPPLSPALFSPGNIGGGRGITELSAAVTEVSPDASGAKVADSCGKEGDTYVMSTPASRVRIPLGTLHGSLDSSAKRDGDAASAENATENAGRSEVAKVASGFVALRYLDGDLDAWLAAAGDEGAQDVEALRAAGAGTPGAQRSAGSDR